jgi:hypothetical protein
VLQQLAGDAAAAVWLDGQLVGELHAWAAGITQLWAEC